MSPRASTPSSLRTSGLQITSDVRHSIGKTSESDAPQTFHMICKYYPTAFFEAFVGSSARLHTLTKFVSVILFSAQVSQTHIKKLNYGETFQKDKKIHSQEASR